MHWETQTTRYEEVKGSGKYLTMRAVMEKSGKTDNIDDYSVSWRGKPYVEAFQDLRRFYDADTPINPRMMADYCEDRCILLDRDERDIIYRMDSAFRYAMVARRSENDKALRDKK